MNCPLCGKGRLKRETRPVTFSYRGTAFTIDQPGDWCEACGEGVLSVDDLAVTAKRRQEMIAQVEGLGSP